MRGVRMRVELPTERVTGKVFTDSPCVGKTRNAMDVRRIRG